MLNYMYWSLEKTLSDGWVGVRGIAAYLRLYWGILNRLQGKVVTHSEKLEWWIILMVDCVIILHEYRAKWLHNPPLK